MTATATAGAQLLPLDLVCLDILRRFFHSCRRGRGGHLVDGVPWIRVTAEDMVGYLQRDGLAVGQKTVQRSLRRLGQLGLVKRLQRFRSRYDRRMWFSPSDTEQQLHSLRPTTIAKQAKQEPKHQPTTVPSTRTQRTDRKDTGVPSSQSSPSNPSSSNGLAAMPPTAEQPTKPNSRNGREPGMLRAEGEHRATQKTHGQPSASHRVGTPTQQPQSPLATSREPLKQPKNTSGSTWDRIRALAAQFNPTSVEQVSPRALIQPDGTRLQVEDGLTSPLR